MIKISKVDFEEFELVKGSAYECRESDVGYLIEVRTNKDYNCFYAIPSILMRDVTLDDLES